MIPSKLRTGLLFKNVRIHERFLSNIPGGEPVAKDVTRDTTVHLQVRNYSDITLL